MILPRRKLPTFLIATVILFALLYFRLLSNESYSSLDIQIPDIKETATAEAPLRTAANQIPTENAGHAEVVAATPYHDLASPQTPVKFTNGNKATNVPASAPTQDEARKKPAEQFPVESIKPLPTGSPAKIPKLQHEFGTESAEAKAIRLKRLAAVKSSFAHSWDGYKTHAWMKDEVSPVTPGFLTTFGGWAATLVDSLDSLWIMGMLDEFEEAVREVKNIDFTKSEFDELNLFETTIRYLGGFLGAYDLSNAKYPILLEKATELGDILYTAFDTPNRMPMTHWNFQEGTKDGKHEASDGTLVAELGSLSLEFTRLSQLSGDSKYFDAIQRITDALEASQNSTYISGLWPTVVNAKDLRFEDVGFTLGGMADSLYEYLPKQYVLLGGLNQQYKILYQNAMVPIKKHIFFRPMTPENANILMSGSAHGDGSGVRPEAKAQHLACFTGGMVGIGAKIFERPDDMAIARKLVDGCIWAYNATQTGIMPELFRLVPCQDPDKCEWDELKWYGAIVNNEGGNLTTEDVTLAKKLIKDYRLPQGFYDILNRQYILRPEAIESVFILYRLTGDPALPEAAWRMFTAIEKHTRTEIASAAIKDVTLEDPPKDNRMESFWLAETLKYFALIFSEPNVVSLDEYVL